VTTVEMAVKREIGIFGAMQALFEQVEGMPIPSRQTANT
jgi:hypothetical protein